MRNSRLNKKSIRRPLIKANKRKEIEMKLIRPKIEQSTSGEEKTLPKI